MFVDLAQEQLAEIVNEVGLTGVVLRACGRGGTGWEANIGTGADDFAVVSDNCRRMKNGCRG